MEEMEGGEDNFLRQLEAFQQQFPGVDPRLVLLTICQQLGLALPSLPPQ